VDNIPSLAVVDGERVGAVSGATLDVVNPATNGIIGQIPRCDGGDVEVAVAAPTWSWRTRWA
jgi:acyl-CoA reductase-like NAD-dependent aldehyde dehydrogenase